jgi:UDP-glucose 4-epimerase
MGGGGFIGKNLVKNFANFSNIIVIGRRQPQHLMLDSEVTYINGDCGSLELLENVIRKDDFIVFLAYNSVPKTSFDNPLSDIRDNLPLAVNLLEVLRKVKIRRVLCISSGGTVYGQTSDSLLISEDHQTNPISPYGITKLAVEKYFIMYARMFDIPVIVARPSNPFGPSQLPYNGQGFIATAAAMIIRGEVLTVFGQTGTVRDYLYIDDLCSALHLLLIMDLAPGEIYNIGSGCGMNNVEVIESISKICGIHESDIRINFLPSRNFDVPYNVLNSSKLNKLGWSPNTSFEAGLDRTLSWISSYLKN